MYEISIEIPIPRFDNIHKLLLTGLEMKLEHKVAVYRLLHPEHPT